MARGDPRHRSSRRQRPLSEHCRCRQPGRVTRASGPESTGSAGRGKMTVIEYKTGDLLAEKADALVNAVNCVGNIGAGIALQFRKAWPENFRAYTLACRNGQLQPGRMFTFETRQLAPPRYIIDFPTKRHWRSSSRLEEIDAGLGALIVEIRRLGLDSIAVPPLGAGLGGLPWNAVRERIERALGALPRLRVVVFGPRGTPEHSGDRRAK